MIQYFCDPFHPLPGLLSEWQSERTTASQLRLLRKRGGRARLGGAGAGVHPELLFLVWGLCSWVLILLSKGYEQPTMRVHKNVDKLNQKISYSKRKIEVHAAFS